MTAKHFGVGLLLALGVASCNQYIYQPEENATAQMGGRTAAIYQIPPERPRGTVRVAGYGVNSKARVLHVRMVVENNALGENWAVDPHQLHVELRGMAAVEPVQVVSDSGETQLINVPPRGRRTVDLFYPLPPEAYKASKIPAFDFVWQVQTPGRTVAERTPFERLEIVPYYYGYGPWGPYWVGPYWAGAPGWYPGWYY
jgi:hypothetical protein